MTKSSPTLVAVILSGLKDIKSSLRGAKLPNGQPMLLDEEQNSLALLIEQVRLQDCILIHRLTNRRDMN